MWKSRRAFYEAMIVFSRKYKHTRASFFPGWLIVIGVMMQAGANFVGSILKTSTAFYIDMFFINGILWCGVTLWFSLSSMPSPYNAGSVAIPLLMHGLLSLSFVSIFAYRGVYSKERYSAVNAIVSGMMASVIFVAAVFFIKSMALSRIAFGVSTVIITFTLVGWREALPQILTRFRRMVFSTGNVVILGSDEVAGALIKNFEEDPSANILGVLWPLAADFPGQFLGYPVLGHIDTIKNILSRQHVDLLLIATDQPWYSHLIEALATVKVRNLTIRWVPTELFAVPRDKLPVVIPLRDFSV